MFKRIDHVEIIPRDMDKSIDFYTRILQFTFKERRRVDKPPLQEIAYLTLGDTMIEFLSMTNPAAPAADPHIGYRSMAIEVDNMDEAIAYLKSKGVEISVPPVSLGTSKRAEIKDLDGLSIELRQW